jgi:hypothetical protein
MEPMRTAKNTGLIRLFTSPQQNEISLILHRGNLLSPGPNGAAEWESQDLIGEVFATFTPLSPQGLIQSNLFQQADSFQADRSIFVHKSPVPMDIFAADKQPKLVKFKWKHAVGSVLFYGAVDQPHTVFASENKFIDLPGVPDAVLHWNNDPTCEVTVFTPDPSLDAWQEILLRRLLKRLYDTMLERFEMQAGRAIVDSFARVVAAFADAQTMHVSIQNRRLVNTEFFATSRSAASSYRAIFGELLEHFSAVIGPRLIASNFREVFVALPPDDRDVIKRNNLLPEGYV